MESVMLRLVIERTGPEAKWQLNEWSRDELARFGIIGCFSVPRGELTTRELYNTIYDGVENAQEEAEEA